MKVNLIVSRTGEARYGKEYRQVLSELQCHRVQVTAGFVLNPRRLPQFRTQAKSPQAKQYANDITARKDILTSDAVVIEATYPSFRLGFEAFYALTLQKPVLVLSKDRDYSDLINQPHFFGSRYTDFTLPDEINKFLKHVKQYRLRSRFNLFISDDHKHKLTQRARFYGVSMSDYLRQLIDKDIDL